MRIWPKPIPPSQNRAGRWHSAWPHRCCWLLAWPGNCGRCRKHRPQAKPRAQPPFRNPRPWCGRRWKLKVAPKRSNRPRTPLHRRRRRLKRCRRRPNPATSRAPHRGTHKSRRRRTPPRQLSSPAGPPPKPLHRRGRRRQRRGRRIFIRHHRRPHPRPPEAPNPLLRQRHRRCRPQATPSVPNAPPYWPSRRRKPSVRVMKRPAAV